MNFNVIKVKPYQSFNNSVYLSKEDFAKFNSNIVIINQCFKYKLEWDNSIENGNIALNMLQRGDLNLALNDKVFVQEIKTTYPNINEIRLTPKNDIDHSHEDIMLMVASILRNYFGHILSVNQSIIIKFNGKNIQFKVSSISTDSGITGFLFNKSKVIIVYDGMDEQLFENVGEIKIEKIDKAMVNSWNFEDLGVGGISNEFEKLFRRAFISRIYPPSLIKKMGIKHVKGILLYGPPGCGKTLLARKISYILSKGKNSVKPIIVNGPELLNKYVGQSEENIRNLFSAAENDYRKKGDNSPLHTIIFDEIDAICVQRGRNNSGTGVDDKIVNQLLTKIDGLAEINNLLIIGMTNRPDMIDNALTRPGRLEIKIEIGLPDENGRYEIFKIHTSTMEKNNKIEDVDFNFLASNTKNFTGAEIEGLVKNAASFALNKNMNKDKEPENPDAIKVTMEDFKRALEEAKPSFGSSTVIERKELIYYNSQYTDILDKCKFSINKVKEKDFFLYNILLYGEKGCGKTTTAFQLALNSEIPMIRVLNSKDLIGNTEGVKHFVIKELFNDLYKSDISVLIIDDLERILEFIPMGMRFSNITLQTLLTYMRIDPPKNHKLIIITTSSISNWDDFGFKDYFNESFEIPLVRTDDLHNFYTGEMSEKKYKDKDVEGKEEEKSFTINFILNTIKRSLNYSDLINSLNEK